MSLLSCCNSTKSQWCNTTKCVSHSHHSTMHVKPLHWSDSGIQALLFSRASLEAFLGSLPSVQLRNKEEEWQGPAMICHGQAWLHTTSEVVQARTQSQSPNLPAGRVGDEIPQASPEMGLVNIQAVSYTGPKRELPLDCCHFLSKIRSKVIS